MLVSEKGDIVEEKELKQPLFTRVAAKLFSYLFHPLFIPTYVFIWLAQRFSFEFSGMTDDVMVYRYISVFWMTAFFPAFAVFLLYRLKFIDSIFLRSRKERIVPYIITMFFYWWMYYLSRNFTDQPEVLKVFYMGIFVASAAALTLNSFFKISMHATGMGGALALVLIAIFHYGNNYGIDLSVACSVTGLVCTSRLLLSTHRSMEVYWGLLVGALCQVVAALVVL